MPGLHDLINKHIRAVGDALDARHAYEKGLAQYLTAKDPGSDSAALALQGLVELRRAWRNAVDAENKAAQDLNALAELR